MGLRPLNDRVLIKRLEEEEKTAGGIIIPDAAKEKPQRGEVVAVGNGRFLDNNQRREMGVKAGEKVLFSKYAGNEIKVDGEELIIMREDEILAVIEA
jgi:chaperonin GroES